MLVVENTSNSEFLYKLQLLNKIDELQKENEKLNIENINLKRNQIIDKSSIPNQEKFYDYYNFISKDKIREKIKELKGNKDFDEDVYVEEFAVNILKELLEEE